MLIQHVSHMVSITEYLLALLHIRVCVHSGSLVALASLLSLALSTEFASQDGQLGDLVVCCFPG